MSLFAAKRFMEEFNRYILLGNRGDLSISVTGYFIISPLSANQGQFMALRDYLS